MTLDIYVAEASPPCYTVLLTAAAINLKFNKIMIDFDREENLTPEYKKLNPQRTVPTLVDDGFPLPESRTIIRYLVDKYGGNSNLYPKDLQARARVDHMLDFDLGTLNQKFSEYYYPQFYGGPPPTEAALKKLQEALGSLNNILEGRKYAAGSDLTIADFSLISTLATIDTIDVSFKDYPNVQKWFDFIKANLPHYEIVKNGVAEYKAYIVKYKAESDR